MTDPLPILRALIRIPSVNPSGNPGVAHTGEKAIANHLRERLARMGGKARIHPVLPGRPNVTAVFRPPGKVRRRILLAPHTDTVSVAGMTIKPFDPVVRAGKVRGRGASDTKGPMAAMLAALARTVKSPAWRASGVEFTFAGLMGEEAGNDGAHAWAAVCPRYDLVIVGEPTGMRVVHAHKGALWLELTAVGTARHASLSGPDDNALYHLLPALNYFREGLPAFLEAHHHPVLGNPTAQITMLAAGSKVNISPDRARAQADIRLVPGLDGRTLVHHLRTQLPPTIRIEITGESAPLHTRAELPLVRRLADALEGTGTAPWFCDAAIFATRGMPAVAVGPGSIEQAHTADEWISVRALRDGTDQLTSALGALLD